MFTLTLANYENFVTEDEIYALDRMNLVILIVYPNFGGI